MSLVYFGSTTRTGLLCFFSVLTFNKLSDYFSFALRFGTVTDEVMLSVLKDSWDVFGYGYQHNIRDVLIFPMTKFKIDLRTVSSDIVIASVFLLQFE